MNETSKCYGFRKQRGDFANYLRGNGIDIGAGPDPLRVDEGTVRAWDLPDGDAQMMPGVPDESYDFVYASHCLEHMRDVNITLQNWRRITKPGGHLYIVVPDYLLYEKMNWPSRFNEDHKQSFSFLITRQAVGRNNHYHIENDLLPLMKSLGLEVIRWTIEDYGYNYNLGFMDQTKGNALSQLCFVARRSA